MNRPAIPLSRCVKCTHYNGTMCVLEDLAPCQFRRTPEAENERAKDIFLVVAFFVAVLFCVLLWLAEGRRVSDQQPAPAAEIPAAQHQSVTAILRDYQRPDTLTDWQLLTLAIAYTESRCNPDSVGKDGDRGILQLRPVYIREVNRLAGTHYTPEDAFDPATAVEIFERMQDCKNPDRSPDMALALHNRGAGYRAEVLRNLELIRRYEAARKTITDK